MKKVIFIYLLFTFNFSLGQNDIKILDAWIYGENSSGIQYGRIPISQVEQNYFIGAKVVNIGSNDQTNISLTTDFGALSFNSSVSSLNSGDTVVLESLESLSLVVGLYQLTFTVSSDLDQSGGANFQNNIIERNFEITNDLYSIDGIDVHQSGSEQLSSITSNVFPDFYIECANLIEINSTVNISGVEILLDTTDFYLGPSDYWNGIMRAYNWFTSYYLSFYDSADFFNGVYPSNSLTSDPIDSLDLINGSITVPVDIDLCPGSYYVAALFDKVGSGFPQGIIDDQTVDQPEYSSIVRRNFNQIHPNEGNAFGIRLVTQPSTSSSGTDVITACESYTWIDGVTYTASNNTATHTLTNAGGCDSVVTLDLTINFSTSGTDVITACESYTWIDGVTYTASNNTATHTLTNAGGCDSVVTLDLTINFSTSGTDVITACDSLTWIDGVTYTASNNTATHTLTNAAGCDSVVTLDLTINYSTSGTGVITACDSLTWIDGITYTSSNNTATHTLTNSAGCDSVVTLDLTINYSTSGTDVITACDSLTWIDGITYTTNNNTATHTLTNSAGCDSVVTLDLTINYSTSGTDVITACDSLTWIDGVTYTSSNNTASHTLTNSAGCDSVVTLDLTINFSTSGTDVITACDSLTWIDGITYTANNNTATHTLTNAAGCDSVVTLDLTINEFNLDFTESSTLFTSPPFSVQFTNNTPNLSNYNFSWDFGDSIVEQNNNSSVFHEYMYNGLYSVVLSAEDLINGCGTDSLVKNDLIFCSGGPNLSIIEVSNNINVFPNPTNENITISVNDFNGKIQTEVFDLIGNKLQTSNETTISLRDYSKGIYILKVTYGNRVEEVKVIKD